MNYMHELKMDITRGKVVTTRGELLEVKEHRGWKYVNYNGQKIGVSKLPQVQPASHDPVFDYVFGGQFQTNPCIAMDYWIIRWRLKRKITCSQFQQQNKSDAYTYRISSK